MDTMPSRGCLVRRWCAHCQGVIPEDRRLGLFPGLRGVPSRRVRPCRGRLLGPHRARQGVMRCLEVFEHLVCGCCGHGPVGLFLGRAQPGRQGGLVLRGGDRSPQAALDGRGLGIVREEAALCVAGGVAHRRVSSGVEEARQSQADRGLVRPEHLGSCHAVGLDALPQGSWQEELVDQEDVHPVPGRVERWGHVLYSACRCALEAAGLPARAEVLRAGLVLASM